MTLAEAEELSVVVIFLSHNLAVILFLSKGWHSLAESVGVMQSLNGIIASAKKSLKTRAL